MKIRIEANETCGRGFQLHLMAGPVDALFDKDPLDLHSAIICANALLEALNREQGTQFRLEEVLLIAGDGLEQRVREDINAARMLEDIQSKQFAFSTPAQEDFRETEINGEKGYVLSGRGAVLTLYFCWKDEKSQKAREGLRRYCEYICAHGRGGGAEKALLELDGLEQAEAVDWIKQTHARHIQDDASMMQYVLGQKNGVT